MSLLIGGLRVADPANEYTSVSQRVREEIRRDLMTGVYRPGVFMPSMDKLAHKYDASRVTVRNALRALADEGLVTIRQGKGTMPNPLARRNRRREPLYSALENFNHWKATVKLPLTFPKLRPVSWEALVEDQMWYMGIPHRMRVYDILQAATAFAETRPQTVVLVTRGHGCTTLFRFIHKNLASERGQSQDLANYLPAPATTAKVIPVRVTWQRLGDRLDAMHEGLERSIRWDVLQELTTGGWQGSLDPDSYTRLIGAMRAGERRPNVQTHLAQVREIIPEENQDAEGNPIPEVPWDKLSELIPAIASAPISELIAKITHELHIKLLLMFDLSMGTTNSDVPRSDEDYSPRLSRLVGLIKDFHEHVGRVNSRGEPIFSEMYFLSNEIQAQIRGVYNRTPHEVVYPHYEQADLFGLLSRHYPPLIKAEFRAGEGGRSVITADLPSILNSHPLNEVQTALYKQAKGFRDFSIVQLVGLFEQQLLERFERDWANVLSHI